MADNTVILFPEEEGSQSLASSLDTKEQKAKEEDAKEEETLGKEAMEEETMEKPPKYSLPKDKDEPAVVRELMTNAPGPFKIPTFFSSVTCLTALATRIRVYYPYDGMNEHALLLQTIITGEQSSGKSFARNNVENVIMAPMKNRDDEQRRQEQAYRELKQTASKTEKLPDAPHTVIRTCPISISIAQLIKRADAPQRYFGTPLTLWSFTDELSAAVESNKRAFSNIKTIARTSYDLHSTYGVDYLSDNSYSATVDILQCSLYLSTPSALDAYADKAFIEGGGVTRTILVELSDGLGEEAPIFKMLTSKQKSTIARILEQMDADVYNESDGSIQPEMYIDMSWIFATVREWCEEQNRLILRSGSRAHNTFFKRSSVSAFRIATLCAYLYGLECGSQKLSTKYRKRVRQIYLFCAQYILDSMLRKWGKRYEELTQQRIQGDSQVRVPVFDQLSKTFTRDQLDEIIKRNEVSTPTRIFLSKWKAKGWIRETQKHVYQKMS